MVFKTCIICKHPARASSFPYAAQHRSPSSQNHCLCICPWESHAFSLGAKTDAPAVFVMTLILVLLWQTYFSLLFFLDCCCWQWWPCQGQTQVHPRQTLHVLSIIQASRISCFELFYDIVFILWGAECWKQGQLVDICFLLPCGS